MTNKKYLPRIIDKAVNRHLNTFGAVCIEGSKWSGKTWIVNDHCKSSIYLRDPFRKFSKQSSSRTGSEISTGRRTAKIS